LRRGAVEKIGENQKSPGVALALLPARESDALADRKDRGPVGLPACYPRPYFRLPQFFALSPA